MTSIETKERNQVMACDLVAFDNPAVQQRVVVFNCEGSDISNTALNSIFSLFGWSSPNQLQSVLSECLSTSGHPSQLSDIYSATEVLQKVCYQELAPDTPVPDEFILDLDYDADSVDCDLMPAPPTPLARVPDVTCHVSSDKKDDDCRSVSSEDSGFQSNCSSVSSSPEREGLDEDFWFVVDNCGDTSELFGSCQSYRKQAYRGPRSRSATNRRHGSYGGNYGSSRWRDDCTKGFKRKWSCDSYCYSDRSSKRRRY